MTSLGGMGKEEKCQASRQAWTPPRLPQQPLSFRLKQLSGLLWGFEHLGGIGPGLIQEPVEYPDRSALAGAHLKDLVLGLLQFVRLVGPKQPSLRLPLLLQRSLSVLPALPRLHALVEGSLWRWGVGEEHNQLFRSSTGSA